MAEKDLTPLFTRVATGLLLFAGFVPLVREVGGAVGAERATRAIEGVETSLGLETIAWLVPSALGLGWVALVAHLLAAFLLCVRVREDAGIAASLITLALWVSFPIALLHGSVFGPENIGLALGLGAAAIANRGNLIVGGSLVVLSGTIGMAGPIFAIAFAKQGKFSLVAALSLLLVVFLPGPDIEGLPELGAHPVDGFGFAGLSAVGLGLALHFGRRWSERFRQFPEFDGMEATLGIGILVWVFEGGSLVLLVPGAAILGALVYRTLLPRLLALKAGLGPVVVAIGLVAVPGLAGYEHMLKRIQAEAAESPEPVE